MPRKGSCSALEMIRQLLRRAAARCRLDNSLRRVFANSSWLFGANTVRMVLAFVEAAVLARGLGVGRYGTLALVTTYTLTVNEFVDSRVWETVIKFVTKYREDGQLARATAVVKLCYLLDASTRVVAFTVLVVTSEIAARLFVKDSATAGLIRFYALSVLVSVPVATSSALLRIANRFGWLAYHTTAMSALRLTGVLGLAVVGVRLHGLVAWYLIVTAASALSLLALSRRALAELNLTPWREATLRRLRGHYRRILGFVILSNLGATSRLITSRADTLILGWLGTPADVGLYRLARVLADPLAVVFGAVYNAVYPELSRLISRGDLEQARSLQGMLSRTIAIIILPVCAILTAGAPWAIPLAFGEPFAASVVLVQIMVWHAIWTVFIWLPGLLLSTERTRTLACLNWLDAAVCLFLLFLLIPAAGAIGASVATLLRFVVWTAMAAIVASHLNRSMMGQMR